MENEAITIIHVYTPHYYRTPTVARKPSSSDFAPIGAILREVLRPEECFIKYSTTDISLENNARLMP